MFEKDTIMVMVSGVKQSAGETSDMEKPKVIQGKSIKRVPPLRKEVSAAALAVANYKSLPNFDM
jgi:hypothetical protein